MRVLLSEGASTSAREAITALGLRGHHIELCDPNPHCIGRFSRFVRKFHRCPPLATDPLGYLAFILERISGNRFDVLLPIHEQGLLFAKARDRISPHAAIALPTFENYVRAHNKVGFSQILSELGLPQPASRVIARAREVVETKHFPIVLKTPIGTASRGTWIVRNNAQIAGAVTEIEAIAGFEQPLVVQDFVDGEHQQAQAVFANGQLIASHAYCQVARGAGGGSAIKESVSHPTVREHLVRLGSYLQWHGALSVDYIVDRTSGMPCYIDCNPRLVEPMSALFAGLDLVDLLLRVSCGEMPATVSAATNGVRTHIAMQALLGRAAEDGSRLSLLRECWKILAKRDGYAGSREELTPVTIDWMSFVPPTVTALWLLATPSAAYHLPDKGWGAQLLTPQSIRTIKSVNIESMNIEQ